MKLKQCLLAAAVSVIGLLPAAAQRTATVAVFSINDFHCAMLQDIGLDVPGAAWVVQTLDSLKQVYPNNVTISAGDNFGGSFYYTATRHQSLLPQMFRDMGITLSVPGNHAFDEGQELWADGWQSTPFCPRDWKMQYIAANMRRDGRVPEPCQPWAVVKIPLAGTLSGENGQPREVSVAITGLMTSNTPHQASARRVKGLTFDGNYSAVLDSLKTLPGYDEVARANVHILATHIGTQIVDGEIRYDDPDADNLMAFDRDDIDGIFSAHSHVEVCGTIGSRRPYPIVQGYCRGKFVSMLLCEVDLESGRCISCTPRLVRVNPHAQLGYKAARLQAQIMEQCQQTTFRGLPITQTLTTCREDMVHNRASNTMETRMGRLVVESYAEAYRKVAAATPGLDEGTPAFVLGVSHFGSIRTGFRAGKVTILDVGDALPFANALRCYRYTGRQLRELMEFGINECQLGRIQTSGLEVTLDKRGHVKRMSWRSPEGQTIEVKDNTRLVLVADDYMTTGGDGYRPAFFPATDLIEVATPASTDAFINFLKTQDEI